MVQILLVEDDPHDVELTLEAFARHHLGNRVRVARDGEEALGYLFGTEEGGELRNRPKLVLLDLKLPLVDGIEVLRRLKADERTRRIPVVVLTSSREESDLAECYQLGVNSYIVKPVDIEQFLETTSVLGMYWVLLNEPPVE